MAPEHASIRRIVVIYNPRSGSLLAAGDDDPEAALRKLFADRGIEAELHACDFKTLPELIRHAAAGSANAVAVFGGDGSILSVVAALGDCVIPLGLIPGGTMNVLARDIGIPTETAEAVDIIANGTIETIDMAFVNDQPFLCNSEIGFMTHLARTREKLRELPWWRRWPAMVVQGFDLLRTYPRLRVTLDADGQAYRVRTRAIVVSNNLLSDAPGPIPPRQSLNAGVLGIYIARDTSFWGLLRLAARMVAGSWQKEDSLEVLSAKSVVLSLDRPLLLSVMNDGEASQLQTPLHYTMRARALRVLVPPNRS